MASTSGQVENSSTGSGNPYPNQWRLSWSVTSTTATAHVIHWTVTAVGGNTGYRQNYYNTSAWISFDGGASLEQLIYNQSGSVWNGDSIASGDYTISHSGEKTFWLRIGGGFGASANYTENTDNWTLPALVTAPTGLAVSNGHKYQNSFDATVSVTGWGGAGDASTRYREFQVWTYNASSLVEPRKYQKATGNTMSSVITVDNNSGYGTLTIEPNTMYTIGMFATNGTYNTSSQRVGDWTTLPPTASLTNSSVTANSATFAYSVPNQGGKYDMAVKYQLDGGSLTNVTTLTGSGAKSGTFTVASLSPSTTHTITLSLTTTVGEVVSNTVTFSTLSATKMYCSVNNTAKKVKRIYCSVGGQRKKVKKIYCSVGGVAKLAYEDVA